MSRIDADDGRMVLQVEMTTPVGQMDAVLGTRRFIYLCLALPPPSVSLGQTSASRSASVFFNAGIAKSSLHLCRFKAGWDLQTKPLKQDCLMICRATTQHLRIEIPARVAPASAAPLH